MSSLMSSNNISNEISYNDSNSGSSSSMDFRLESFDTLGFGIPNSPYAARIIHYCMGTLILLIGIAGFSGNGLVLYVFTKYRRLRGGGGPLILSLATGDFLVSLLHGMQAYSSFAETWQFGYRGCEFYAAGVGLGGLASLLTLSAIAADRFSVIVGRPLTWLAGKKTCLAIWFFCFLLVFPPFVGWSRYTVEGMGTSCSWDYTSRDYNNRMYYIFLLFFGFCVPVFVISVSYIGILRVVCKQSYQMNGISRNGVVNKRTPTKSDLKTAQVILTIIFFFLASWTPYAIVSLIGQFGDASLLSPLVKALPAIFAKASVIYNPIVYSLSHPHFRSAVRMLLARYWQPTNNPPGGLNDNGGLHQRCHYRPTGKSPCRRQPNAHRGIEGSRMTQNSRTEGRTQNPLENTEENLLGRESSGFEPLRRYGVPGMFCSDCDERGSDRRAAKSDPGTMIDGDMSFSEMASENSKASPDLSCNHNGWVFRSRISYQESILTAKSVLPPLASTTSAPIFSDPNTEQYNMIRQYQTFLKRSEMSSLVENRRKKRDRLRRSLFRSESCLEYILQKQYRKKMMTLSDKDELPSHPSTATANNSINNNEPIRKSNECINTELSVPKSVDNTSLDKNDKHIAQKDFRRLKLRDNKNLLLKSTLATLTNRNTKLPKRKHYKVQKMIPIKRTSLVCYPGDFAVERICTAIARASLHEERQSDYVLENEKCTVVNSHPTWRQTPEDSIAVSPLTIKRVSSVSVGQNSIHIVTNPWENEDNHLRDTTSGQFEMENCVSKNNHSQSESCQNYMNSSICESTKEVNYKSPRNFLKWQHKAGCDRSYIYYIKDDFYSSIN